MKPTKPPPVLIKVKKGKQENWIPDIPSIIKKARKDGWTIEQDTVNNNLQL